MDGPSIRMKFSRHHGGAAPAHRCDCRRLRRLVLALIVLQALGACDVDATCQALYPVFQALMLRGRRSPG